MRAVNLLPADAAQRKSIRKEDPAVVIGSALGVIVLLALVASFLNVHSKVNVEQGRLTAVQLELAKLSEHKRSAPPPSGPVHVQPIIPVPAVVSQQQPWLAAVSTAMSTRIAWDRILREFSLVLPTDVAVTSMSLTAPVATTIGPPSAGSSRGLTIAGTTFSHDAVARLLSRLMLVPDLTNVTLASSSAAAATGTGPSLVSFSISAGVKGAPAPPTPAVTTTTDTTTTGTTTGASQ
jgi:Tfp pilus assembly protein PilN